jgi:hypothetical protein
MVRNLPQQTIARYQLKMRPGRRRGPARRASLCGENHDKAKKAAGNDILTIALWK